MAKRIIGFTKVIKIFFIIVILIIYCFAQNNWIKIENIKIEIDNLPKNLNGFKIAHISDVHLPKNGSNIKNILNKVKNQKPDIIVLTGDIIDESANIETCGLDKFCKGLSQIAKTYAVSGNHEFWNGHITKWKKILRENSIEVVDDKIVLYTKNHASFVIAGLSDGRKYTPGTYKEMDKLKNIPIILLAHRPELLLSYSSHSTNPVLVFSGHAHGGQFRIPFLNIGLISPNQGFFPKYTSGIYTSKTGVKMIVSRGLGNSIIPIRINNRPHLPIIELVAK